MIQLTTQEHTENPKEAKTVVTSPIIPDIVKIKRTSDTKVRKMVHTLLNKK